MSKRGLVVGVVVVASLIAAWFVLPRGGGEPVEPASLPASEDSPARVETTEAVSTPAAGSDAREGVASEAENKSVEQRAKPSADALLRVTVVATETGQPLAHAHFEMRVSDDCEFWSPRFPTLESDASGRADLAVMPGIRLGLTVRLHVEPFSSEYVSIEPLAKGERRDLRVELRTSTDLHFWARIVRDEDGARLPFTRAELVYENPANEEALVRRELAADAEALIEIDTCSWKESVLLVDVEGFAQASARIVPGHETSDKAFELRLARAARLNVLVQDPAGAPQSGLTVRASAASYELSQSDFWFDDAAHVRSTFEAVTGGDGRAALSGLPPRVEIELSVHSGEQLLMRERVKQRLDTGQVKDVVLVVGGKATLVGRAVDQTGRAVPDQLLWLVKPDSSMGMAFRAWTQPSGHARTDADGRFEFPDIAEGEWWVGPWTPPGIPPDKSSGLASYGERVTIPPGAGRFEVVLHLWRGLYISGHVRVSSGEPAAGCSVLTQSTSGEHTGYLSTKTDEAGAFELGPLCGVEYELRAGGAFQGEFAESPRTLALAGVADLVLVVERAAILRGVVIDEETNAPCDAMIHVTQANLTEGMAPSLGSQTRDGAFELSGITAGVWDVSATARNARMGTQRVTLAAGETKEIKLRATASVVVTFKNTSAADYFYVHPFSDGLGLELAGVEAGQEARLNLPPGRIKLRISDPNAKTLATREIDVAPGTSAVISYP